MFTVASPFEALRLLDLPDGQLFQQADYLRNLHFGKTIDLCAIINAKSGNCGMDCAFCPQSSFSGNDKENVWSLDPVDLAGKILRLSDFPLCHIGIVTSGARLGDEELDELISVLHALDPATQKKICVSLGRLRQEQLERLRASGVLRYHHNLESSARYYPAICSTQTWQERAKTVQLAAKAGLENCTGALFGLGESWEDRISLAFSLKKLKVKNIPINFLDPRPGTRLAGLKAPGENEALRIVALVRHILSEASLRICGGRPRIFGGRLAELIHAGANAIMTGDYLTTGGNNIENDIDELVKNGFRPAH